MAGQDPDFERLPQCAADYIRAVIKRMRYRRRVRGEVARELADHFADALAECTSDQERQGRAARLIEDFGDAKLLAVLIRRGKKRCRPAWKKAIVRSFQTCGVLLVLMILYTGWFLTGKPGPTVDYVAVLNEKTRPTADEEDNAWPYYQRALELYAEPPQDIVHLLSSDGWSQNRTTGFARLSDAERRDLTTWLDENKAAWDQYVSGSRQPHLWMEYATGGGADSLSLILLPSTGWLRNLSRAGIWQARIALGDGRCEEALADCLAVARTARLWHRPTSPLIEQLVAWGIGLLADEELLYMAGSGRLSEAALSEAQSQLEAAYQTGWPPMDLESEKLSFVDLVQRCFTRGGFGGGHLIPRHLAVMTELFAEWTAPDCVQLDFGELVTYTGISMVQARRHETLAKAHEVYGRLSELVNMSPYNKRVHGIADDDVLAGLGQFRYALFHLVVPHLTRASEFYHQRRATYQATITVMALRRWRSQQAQYPESLNELVAAGHIKAVPDDPYSDGALKYERRGDEFVLYSLGEDFDDDGGVQTSGDAWGRKEQGGDRVFWPVK